MRRGLGLCLGLLAVAGGCSAFGTDQTGTPATTGDGGAALDGAIDGASTLDGGAAGEGGLAGTCLSAIQDTFDRKDLVAAPWRQLFAPDPARVKIIGEALDIETQDGVGPEKYMLTTGPFKAPKQIACSFDFTPLTDFSSQGGKPIDLFVVVLTAADATSTFLHFGYFDSKIVVREEHFDAEGHACATCSNGQDSQPLQIAKSDTAKLEIAIEDASTKLTRNADLATRPFGLSGAVSAEILFGIWNFSPYAQQGDLDDLQCSLTCP